MGWETFVFTDTAVPAELGDDLGLDLAPVTLVGLADTRPGRWHGRELRRLRSTRARGRHQPVRSRPVRQRQVQEPAAGLRTAQRLLLPLPAPARAGGGEPGAPRVPGYPPRGRTRRDRPQPEGLRRDLRRGVGQLAFTAGHVERRWGVQPRIVHPPCEQVPALAKQHEIAVVGRLQKPGAGIPYKAQDILVRTFAELTDLHERGWRLVLAGAARRRTRRTSTSCGAPQTGSPSTSSRTSRAAASATWSAARPSTGTPRERAPTARATPRRRSTSASARWRRCRRGRPAGLRHGRAVGGRHRRGGGRALARPGRAGEAHSSLGDPDRKRRERGGRCASPMPPAGGRVRPRPLLAAAPGAPVSTPAAAWPPELRRVVLVAPRMPEASGGAVVARPTPRCSPPRVSRSRSSRSTRGPARRRTPPPSSSAGSACTGSR